MKQKLSKEEMQKSLSELYEKKGKLTIPIIQGEFGFAYGYTKNIMSLYFGGIEGALKEIGVYIKSNEEVYEEMKKALLEVYQRRGYLTFKLIYEELKYNQKKVEKNFGNLQSLHDKLGVEYVKKQFRIFKCLNCGKDIKLSKFSDPKFGKLCDECNKTEDVNRIKNNNVQYNGLEKDYDYAECPGCGYRSKSLEGHYRENNETWTRCPYKLEDLKKKYGEFRIHCFKSASQARETRKENGWFTDPEYSKFKILGYAGKHIKGKTKETYEPLMRQSETKKKKFASGELVAHNKNKNKENYEPLRKASENIKKAIKEHGFWNQWRKIQLNLSFEDFKPYINEEGFINGKRAMKELDISYGTLTQYYELYNLKARKRFKLQKKMLNLIKKITSTKYIEEFYFENVKWEETSRYVRFDGFFSKLGLIVEVQGGQHFEYSSFFFKSHEEWEKYIKRDKIRKRIVFERGLKFLEITDKDDEKSIRRKLIKLGIKGIR